MTRVAILVLVMLTIPVVSYSAIIEVPKDFTTIQAAIDAAVKGDTVLVAPGTYLENINFSGKEIIVTSSGGPVVTIIDGGKPIYPQYGSVVTFTTNEGSSSVLDGFTLTNGSGRLYNTSSYFGGGISCNKTSPTIRNNIISNNTAAGAGGGIECTWSSPHIVNNIICDNSAIVGGGINSGHYSHPVIANNTINANKARTDSGGGIYCTDDVIIENNVIVGNSARDGGGILCDHFISNITNNLISENTASWRGGGIWCNSSTIVLANNIITKNKAMQGGGVFCAFITDIETTNNTISFNTASSAGGGIFCDFFSTINMTNTIVWDNKAPSGSGIWLGFNSYSSYLNVSYSDLNLDKSTVHIDPGCILTVGSGMIDSDPLFVDQGKGDYHLTYLSPCKDTGDNAAVTGLTDFEGDPRIAYGTVDMGADEFHTHLYHTGDATAGGAVELKLVDLPGTSPVILWIGSGVLDPPFNSNKYGDWYLQPPLLMDIYLGTIPSPSGVLSLSHFFNPLFPTMDIPMQVLIGKKLTNLCVMSVK